MGFAEYALCLSRNIDLLLLHCSAVRTPIRIHCKLDRPERLAALLFSPRSFESASRASDESEEEKNGRLFGATRAYGKMGEK